MFYILAFDDIPFMIHNLMTRLIILSLDDLESLLRHQ
jgi:hypothetical protein